jgi:SecD/SecF fusion protein
MGTPMSATSARRLSELNLGDIQAQEFGTPRDVLIRVQAQGGGENAEQTVITLVRAELEGDYDIRRVEVVGPTVSGELAQAGTIAVIASLMAILVYIWFRFEWQFALGAIIATMHDVVLTIGIFVISGIEFNLSSIAAVLTIVGYSLNDTVVVYDRVRENLRRYKKLPLTSLLDLSINQMLPRTILTSVTTLLALSGAVHLRRRSDPVLHLCDDLRRAGRHLFVDLHRCAGAHPVQAEGRQFPRRT